MIVKANGISINCEVTGGGQPLVLTHGLGGNLHTWDKIAPLLSGRYKVITWDIRGHGQTEKAAGDYTPALLAADLAGLLGALDIESAYCLGHSMGGMISLRFALDYPGMCDALTVSSSSAEVGAKATQYWQVLAAAVMQNGMQAAGIIPGVLFSKTFIEGHPKEVARFVMGRLANDAPSYARSALAISSYNFNTELPRLHCPTLVLVGDQDMLATPGASVKLSRLITGAKLLMFKGAGHMSYLEQPEAYAKAVIEFLESLPR